MSRRQWTFPELYDAARMVEDGASWQDVADRFGVKEQTLRSQLTRHNIPTKKQKRGPKLRHGLMLRAIAARNRGNTWRQVRDEVAPDMEVGTIRAAVRRYSRREGNRVLRGFVA